MINLFALIPITYTGEKYSFYLHGGFFERSAGSIDAGKNVSNIYNLLKNQKHTILTVEY